MKRKSIFIILLIISFACSSCGHKSKIAEDDSMRLTKNTEKLSVFTSESPYVENLDTNEFTKWYQEKTNIEIEWQISKGNLEKEKELLFSNGNYPDVIFNADITRADQLLYGEQGILLDLAELIDKNTIYLKEIFKNRPDIKNDITAPDGKIYGLPQINEVYHTQYPAKMWVYKPWLDTLGLKEPQTTEEFYQMLKAFKEKDPNCNGLADEIPFASTGSLGENGYDEFLLNSFVYTRSNRLRMLNGKVDFIGDDEEYREGLRYLNRLFKEGLLYNNSLLDDRKALTKIGENPEPILGSATALWYGMFTEVGGDSKRYSDYVAISPLIGPKGVRQTPKYSHEGLGSQFSITNNCENPEVAIKWIDWFYSMEGTLTSQYGFKDDGWRMATPDEIGVDGNRAIWTPLDDYGTEKQNSTWQNFGTFYLDEKLRNGVSGDLTEKLMYDFTKNKYVMFGVDESVKSCFIDTSKSEEFMTISQKVDSIIKKSMMQFVSGEKSLDTDWNEYIENLNKAGINRYIEIYQENYDRNKIS